MCDLAIQPQPLQAYDAWSNANQDEAINRIDQYLRDNGAALVNDIVEATNVHQFLLLRNRVLDELQSHVGSTGARVIEERRKRDLKSGRLLRSIIDDLYDNAKRYTAIERLKNELGF